MSLGRRLDRLEELRGPPFEVLVVAAPENGRDRQALARARVGEDGSLLIVNRPEGDMIKWEWERPGGHVVSGTIEAPGPTGHESYSELFEVAREILEARDRLDASWRDTDYE